MLAFRLLIIDSSKNFSKAAQQFLLRKNVVNHIDITGEVQDAKSMARRLKPDLILIELELLKKVDPSFCHQLKLETPGAIIIGLTLFKCQLFCPGPFESYGIDSIISREHFADDIKQLMRDLTYENMTYTRRGD